MSERMAQIASRAAARIQRLSLVLKDRYLEDEMDWRAEAEQHLKDYGHTYDDNCTAEFCTKWREFVNEAQAQARGGV